MPTIKVRKNGPYLVTGTVDLTDHEGNAFESKKSFELCRCGHSKNKPFCDDSHKEVAFDDEQ